MVGLPVSRGPHVHSPSFFPGTKYDGNGILVIGANDTMLTSYDGGGKLKSGRSYADLKAIPDVFPKYSNWDKCHYEEWIRACKGGPAAGSNFAYASKLTELCLLSNVAVRARRPIDWDAAAMKVTNLPAANQYITKQYRPGFGV